MQEPPGAVALSGGGKCQGVVLAALGVHAASLSMAICCMSANAWFCSPAVPVYRVRFSSCAFATSTGLRALVLAAQLCPRAGWLRW